MIAGIDLGSSETDLVVLDGNKVIFSLTFVNGGSEIKKIKSILKKFKLSKVNATGAYSGNLALSGCEIRKINEIEAIGKGGLFISGEKDALVVSIGSGTAMVSCRNGFSHIGGTAIGGRTLTGLGKIILNTDDITKIDKSAQGGNIKNVDLMVGDIYPEGIGILEKNSSASHFGKLMKYNDRDIALGLVNMAAQSIGTLAVFGARACSHKKIVLIGGLTKLKTFRKVIKKRINILSDIQVEIPKNAAIAAAIGAALG